MDSQGTSGKPKEQHMQLLNDQQFKHQAAEWTKAFLIVAGILALMVISKGAFASEGAEFEEAATKWNELVTGNLGKMSALICLGVGSVVAAVKKDWSWFFGAVILSVGVGVIVGVIDASFTATI
jgi:conjugal transfer pilus assembly protein TraA